MVMAFSKCLCLALVQICHICTHAHTHTATYFTNVVSFCACLVMLSLAICYWPQMESGKYDGKKYYILGFFFL